MSDRFPLVVDSTQGQIKELPSGDNINLSNNNIVGVNSIFTGAIEVGGVLYPKETGGNGQVLTSDGIGSCTWKDSSVSGLPSGDAGDSLVFNGNSWVVSPQNFDVETTSDPDWNFVTLLIPFNSETGTPGGGDWQSPFYGTIGGTQSAPGQTHDVAGYGTTFATVGTVRLDDRDGTQRIKFGDGAVRFVGETTGYLEFSNSGQEHIGDLGADSFTLEFWFSMETYPTSSGGNDAVIAGANSTGGNNTGNWRVLYDDSHHNLVFHDFAGYEYSIWDYSDEGSVRLIRNKWYHVAISRENNDLRVYRDGVQIGNKYTNSTDFTLNTTSIDEGACLRLGASPYGTGILGFQGNIDDFRITVGKARYTTSSFILPTQGFVTSSTSTINQIKYPLNLHTDVDVVSAVPTDGQVLTWNATGGPGNNGAWVPALLSQNSRTAAYTPVRSDIGKHIYTDSGVTLNGDRGWIAGDNLTIVNKHSANTITITLTGINAYLAGSATAQTVSSTLAIKGVVTILFTTPTECYMSGDIS